MYLEYKFLTEQKCTIVRLSFRLIPEHIILTEQILTTLHHSATLICALFQKNYDKKSNKNLDV